MSKKILYSLKLEQHIIAGLLKYPNLFHQISQFLKSDDFGDPSLVNPSLYNLIGASVNASEPIDPVLIAQKATSLRLTFEDGISVFDYLQSLGMRGVTEEACIAAAKAVKKYSIRRAIINNAQKLQKEITDLDDDVPFDQIISMSDKIYNNQLDVYFNNVNKPQNVFDDMEQNIEYRGENPNTDVGILTHLPRLNEIYGSVLRPGNITVIAARYGVGKSSLALEICCKAGAANKIPVLHFDNGEQSLEEIQNRMCAAISGVPLYFIESGKWRNNETYTKKVRDVWTQIKDRKFYYYNVGGMDYKEMINCTRRWYYSEVKRGNRMIWSFDYIKMGSAGGAQDMFWANIGTMLNDMKTFIAKELVFENKPQVTLFTSVQSNRSGISQNRNSADLDESENQIGLSDLIGQICSHLFILRKKTTDEIISEGDHFGTHKLIGLKARHMGINPNRAFDLVCMPDGSKKRNYINLEFKNFCVVEKGDLIDMVDSLDIRVASPAVDGRQDSLPI